MSDEIDYEAVERNDKLVLILVALFVVVMTILSGVGLYIIAMGNQ